jgi:SAM-dependent methyltransferase
MSSTAPSIRRRGAPFSPTPASLGLIDRVAARIEPDDPGLVEWYRGYAAAQRARLALDLDLVELWVPRSAAVLEYGSVPLVLTAALRERGFSVQGLDLAPDRFASAIKSLGLTVRRCDVETERVPFSDASVDAILFNELFEHLRIDPIFTLQEALRVLRPGGHLLLSTPNLLSLSGLVNLLVRGEAHSCSGDVYAQYEKLKSLGHMGHTREYTAREVMRFLDRSGFEVSSVLYRGGHPSRLVRLALEALPGLRPFATFVATRRPAATPTSPDP